MTLWRRASGALKDRKALLSSSLSRRTSYRIPDLEAAIIKATNHNEKHVDYRNAQRVFAWICASPVSLKPLMWALSNRMEKTKSWVVALKGLMLMHGIFCCKTPAVLRIKKLSFNLSNFSHAHSHNSCGNMMWGFSAFIRSYYTYLDHRWSLLYGHIPQSEDQTLLEHLVKLEKLQSLLAILLQIKPAGHFMKVNLILEAMDCVVIEIFDVHNRICNVIANVLTGIHSARKDELLTAIKLLMKALIQWEDVEEYFELCNEFGVFNTMEIPQLRKIPVDEIRGLKYELNNNGVSERRNDNLQVVVDMNIDENEKKENVASMEEEKRSMKTVITEKWEVFEEDNNYEFVKINEGNSDIIRTSLNPFETSSNDLPLVPIPVPVYNKHDQIPDFITFY